MGHDTGALIPTTSSCRRNGWSFERTPPRVPVRREGPHFIFTQPCPYCGQKHRHGVGDNGFCYGHRTVHCTDPHARLEETTLGYILVPGAERERLRGHLLEVLRQWLQHSLDLSPTDVDIVMNQGFVAWLQERTPSTAL
jgi:hypothetical protein